MYEKIASGLVNKLRKSNPELRDKDLSAICAYGIELLLSTVTNYILIILIGLITSRLSSVFVFSIVFNSMRKYIGGYHCTTYIRCNITFCFIFGTILFLSNMLCSIASISLLIMILLVSGYGVWYWGPVENHFKPISKNQKDHFHTIAKTIFVITSILAIVCYIWLPYHAWVTALSTLAVTVLLPLGTIAERRRYCES